MVHTVILNTSLAVLGDRVSGMLMSMQTAAGQLGAVTNMKAISIIAPAFAGTKPTDNYGIQISNQGASGVTTSYGIAILAQSGSTTNYGIDSAAIVRITDATVSSSTTTGALVITGGVGIGGATFCGGNVNLGNLTASLPLKLDGSKNIISQAISLTTDVSGTLPVGNGGTGQTTFTAGSLLLGNVAGAIASLADIATGSVLTSGGVATS